MVEEMSAVVKEHHQLPYKKVVRPSKLETKSVSRDRTPAMIPVQIMAQTSHIHSFQPTMNIESPVLRQ